MSIDKGSMGERRKGVKGRRVGGCMYVPTGL